MPIIGEYLGRPVRVLGVPSPLAIASSGNVGGDAVALLCCERWTLSEWQQGLPSLFAAAPVAVGFWGDDAEVVLDSALDIQAGELHGPHVLTYLLTSGTAVEAMWELFHLVFPTPERLSEWRGYALVISACEEDLGQHLRSALAAGYAASE